MSDTSNKTKYAQILNNKVCIKFTYTIKMVLETRSIILTEGLYDQLCMYVSEISNEYSKRWIESKHTHYFYNFVAYYTLLYSHIQSFKNSSHSYLTTRIISYCFRLSITQHIHAESQNILCLLYLCVLFLILYMPKAKF